MKPLTFSFIVGIVALIEVCILWIAVDLNQALLIQVAFLAGVAFLYLLKKTVSKDLDDERTKLISQKAASRTLEIFWVVFVITSLGNIVVAFNRPAFVRPFFDRPPLPPESEVLRREGFHFFGYLGFIQMVLLCLMIFLYAGFRFYYGRKYGEWETDEE